MYKIGYTTGVFDMFHIGHLNILRQAKMMCEHLIVGVSTDDLVKEYKHKLPIIPYEERIELLRACRYVDEVVPQVNRNKIEAYQRILFDVMFVGDDWRGSKLFEETETFLRMQGVDVIYFPYTQDISSSILRERIKKLIL
ncbi:adenylyltransferase/cytidyltransferase family protein [uncultured Parabacteroides sp.]|uniref:adenylyltransferase/cytidyltransferase family protein n=1 Tax=uncultured Parabacteroides sp. TaxID=512312 RepID=UPI0026361BA7|nr:adenylyltransferase/cytidyltransferase family protein [uncultured Parabacteroides sp.]